jgi:hypothetical protein
MHEKKPTFASMGHLLTKALVATTGHCPQFTGDGLMALDGNATDPATGSADAVRGAREMLSRLDKLNYQLQDDS